MGVKTRPRLAKPVMTSTEKTCRRHGARAGPYWDCGGRNQDRLIEQVAPSNVQRMMLSGPCTSSGCGERRSTKVPTKPPERRAVTVAGLGVGDGGGVPRRCQVPAGLVAFRASMNVHSMHRPGGPGGRVPPCASLGGGHRPGGEL